MMDKERRWFAGIDWASQEHVVSLSDDAGDKIGQREFAHGGTGLTDMIAWLLKASGGKPSDVHVAIETPHGPIVEALLERSFNVYSINPKQLDRFRDRFTVSGAKDDSATPMCWRTASGPICERSESCPSSSPSSSSSGNGRASTRSSRLSTAVSPADSGTNSGAIIHRCWSLPTTSVRTGSSICSRPYQRLRRRPMCVRRPSHGSSRIIASVVSTRPHVLSKLRKPALAVAPGTIEAATACIRGLIERIRLINDQLADAGRQLDRLCKKLSEPVGDEGGETARGRKNEQPDAAILDSLPGVARTVLATLLAEASDLLQRRDYHALRALCGSAPVTRRSGKSCVVVRRYACNRRLRNATFYWTQNAVRYDPTCRAKYDALRAKGHGHARALRSVIYRLLNVACAMLNSGSQFDPKFASKRATG
jgi:Transposase/Transposase IS116/IS110/IS902 family